MADCPKCRGRMTQGFLYLPDTGGRVKWMDGEPGFWKTMMGIGAKSAELGSRRCTECGYVEFFADPQAKPVKTLKSIDAENERLRRRALAEHHFAALDGAIHGSNDFINTRIRDRSGRDFMPSGRLFPDKGHVEIAVDGLAENGLLAAGHGPQGIRRPDGCAGLRLR